MQQKLEQIYEDMLTTHNSFDDMRHGIVFDEILYDQQSPPTVQILWEHSDATYFVYSFFLFNSMYSKLDWERSILEDEICRVNEDGVVSNEWQQIRRFIEFTCKRSSQNVFSEAIQKSLEKIALNHHQLAFDDGYAKSTYRNRWRPDIFDGIVPDSGSKGIRRNHIEKAKAAWRSLFNETHLSQDEYLRNMTALHELVYMIRCNIFHGRKTPDQYKDERIAVYAAIINATVDLFFMVTERR
jgi:hypothetical protein